MVDHTTPHGVCHTVTAPYVVGASSFGRRG